MKQSSNNGPTKYRPPGPDLHINAAARILGTEPRVIKELLAKGTLCAYLLDPERPRSLRIRRESVIELRNRQIPPSEFAGGAR
jgi:hypothetical protein